MNWSWPAVHNAGGDLFIIAMHIWLDSAWRFRDEWTDEPEFEWFPEYMKKIASQKQRVIARVRAAMHEEKTDEDAVGE